MAKEIEIIEIEGKLWYVCEDDYFENEIVAESQGYYWDDEISKWAKEITEDNLPF